MSLAARLETQLLAQEFLFIEAELLDGRELRAWLELLAEDIRYVIPARRTLAGGSVEEEFSDIDTGILYMDETKETLTARVAKLETNTAWAENPPSRTRRLISNVRVKGEQNGTVEVYSNFYVYKSRLENTEDIYIGERRDLLRRSGDGFQLCRRIVYLDQVVLMSKNISIFL